MSVFPQTINFSVKDYLTATSLLDISITGVLINHFILSHFKPHLSTNTEDSIIHPVQFSYVWGLGNKWRKKIHLFLLLFNFPIYW